MKTLAQYAATVEEALPRFLPKGAEGVPGEGEMPALQAESMRYSLLSGGKRLRPAMLLACTDMLGGDPEEALPVACALEMIHTYSLIHDDLPGMDNDTLRRGRPTNHVVFGEGQAILAGDGLLNQAYEVLLENALSHPEHATRHVQAMHDIALCAGSRGMIAGQCLDLLCEREPGRAGEDSEARRRMLRCIQENKTSRLLIAPLRAAAALAGYAPDSETTRALTAYGLHFGLLFQTVDDLLDVLGDEKTLGKSIGKDAQEGKLTTVSLLGLSGAQKLADELTARAVMSLDSLGEKAEFFRALARDMRTRIY